MILPIGTRPLPAGRQDYATPPYFLLISSRLYPSLYFNSSLIDSSSEETSIFSKSIKGLRDFVDWTLP